MAKFTAFLHSLATVERTSASPAIGVILECLAFSQYSAYALCLGVVRILIQLVQGIAVEAIKVAI